MTQPNFLIIGAQKAGSTWLALNLRQHPEIFMYPTEIQYFNLESNYAKGDDWYAAHFAAATVGQRLVGEKTPNYMWITDRASVTPVGTHLPELHLAIHRYMPEAKLIVMLRDPVDRAVSAINHYMRHGQLSPLVAIDDYLVGSRRAEAAAFGVFAMSDYYQGLRAYLDCFTNEQLLILEFAEDLVQVPVEGLRKCCEFLGVDADYEFAAAREKVNEFFDRSVGVAYALHRLPASRPYVLSLERRLPDSLRDKFLGPPLNKQKPSAGARAELACEFAASNAALFDLIGRRYDHWTKS